MKLYRIACWSAAAVAAGLCACDPKPAKPKTDAFAAAPLSTAAVTIGPATPLAHEPLAAMSTVLVEQGPQRVAGAGLRPSRGASGINP